MYYSVCMMFFFFFKQKTAYEVRISDWSSDVCSSDLVGPVDIVVNNAGITRDGTLARMSFDDWNDVMRINLGGCFNMAKASFPGMEIGRASCRERVCQYV